MITGEQHSSSTYSLNQLTPLTYIVLDHKPIKVQTKSGKIVDAVIMTIFQDPKMAVLPDTDVLLCYAPTMGAIHEIRAIIPSVLFWMDKFWTPFLSTTPSRIDLAHELQLDGANQDTATHHCSNIDIIYEINVVDIPELDWGLFNY